MWGPKVIIELSARARIVWIDLMMIHLDPLLFDFFLLPFEKKKRYYEF